MAAFQASSRAGSSPLARGLPWPLCSWAASTGIIPARAGFTVRTTSPPSTARDHPRSRGVYALAGMPVAGRVGSSPLARGLHPLPGAAVAEVRIIPARAGFTRGPTTWTPSKRDHPRSRGVYRSGPRGAPALRRIIPARAGFTVQRLDIQDVGRDHPRSRGVYATLCSECTAFLRIIPARAGFTTVPAQHRAGPPDHPRSRGVYDSARPA